MHFQGSGEAHLHRDVARVPCQGILAVEWPESHEQQQGNHIEGDADCLLAANGAQHLSEPAQGLPRTFWRGSAAVVRLLIVGTPISIAANALQHSHASPLQSEQA